MAHIDKELEEIIAQFPKLGQRQYDLETQKMYLSKLAIKLGLYDADEFLWKLPPPSVVQPAGEKWCECKSPNISRPFGGIGNNVCTLGGLPSKQPAPDKCELPKPSCYTCKYYISQSCRRHAPIAVITENSKNYPEPRWATMIHGMDWCGDYEIQQHYLEQESRTLSA